MKKERLCFPLRENNGMNSIISEHFGHAPFLGLYDTETQTCTIIKNTLEHHNPAIDPIAQLQELLNPTIIFAKSIGKKAIRNAKEKGIIIKTSDYTTIQEAIININSLHNNITPCNH